jgi:hypothetical protein
MSVPLDEKGLDICVRSILQLLIPFFIDKLNFNRREVDYF